MYTIGFVRPITTKSKQQAGGGNLYIEARSGRLDRG